MSVIYGSGYRASGGTSANGCDNFAVRPATDAFGVFGISGAGVKLLKLLGFYRAVFVYFNGRVVFIFLVIADDNGITLGISRGIS